MFKRKLHIYAAAVALAATAANVPADDTEIYLDTGGSVASTAPQVMFHIQYDSNLASTICTGVDGTSAATIASTCPQAEGVELYFADGDFDDTTIDQFELTRAALKRVLAELGNIDIGILMPHAHDNACAGPTSTNCSGGGFILHRMVRLDSVPSGFDPDSQTDLDNLLDTDSNKESLFDTLDALPSPHGGTSHDNQLSEIYYELFRYLTGQGVYNGHNGWSDMGTDSNYNLGDWQQETSPPTSGEFYCLSGSCTSADSGGIYAANKFSTESPSFFGDFAEIPRNSGEFVSTHVFQWDPAAEDGSGNYISPLFDCSKVFVINVLNGSGNQQNDAHNDIELSLANGGMGFRPTDDGEGFIEIVQWLNDKDLADGSINSLDLLDQQNVTSYFIAKQAQQLDAAANAGGTGTALELTESAQDVVDAIQDIFNNILSVSTTFVSASIPVNVFNRSEVLDNTYLALFEANNDGQPAWLGNVKKLKLDIYQICQQFDANDPTLCLEYKNYLQLVDALGQDAIADDGRIRSDSRTFWTDVDGYDLYDNLNTNIETDGYIEEAGFDGRTVDRGGAGQKVPGMLNSSLDATTLHYEAGDPGWANAEGIRKIYTDYNDQTALIPVEWNYISVLWPYIFDAASGDWPTVYDPSTGNAVTPTGNLSTDYALRLDEDYARYLAGRVDYDPSGFTAEPCSSTYITAASGYPFCYPDYAFPLGYIAANLMAYIRGYETQIDTSGDVAGALSPDLKKSRRWMFGDPLHSRPLPINYGARDADGYSESNPDIRIILGTNDGFLRMLRNTDSSGNEVGEEVWAYMPKEVMNIQKQLMDNAASGDPIHPYGVDGAVSAYVYDSASDNGRPNNSIIDGECNTETTPERCDAAYIFFGLRRGGQSYYALDITDPDDPQFMWSVHSGDTGFEEMGYTFSQPVVRQLDWGHPDGVKPVIIVGGGYDMDKDTTDGATVVDDDKGNAIYIIDAETGDLVWKATGSSTATLGTNDFLHTGMDDSIASAVTAIDADGDQLADQVYVGDTGGNLWRLDLYGTDPSNWQATELLSLGRHGVNSSHASSLGMDSDLAKDRRFFHAPDVVPARDETGRFMAVVLGSGNRAHPLQTHTLDGVFMYKDRTVGNAIQSHTTLTIDDLFDATDNCIQEVDITCTSTADLANGWALFLLDEGEKTLSSVITLRGDAYFSTYLPITSSADAISCGPQEGKGYEYRVAVQDATAIYNFDTTNTTTDNDGNTVELQKEDRRELLDSEGIPSDHVYVSYTDEDGNNFTGLIASDLDAGDDLGRQQLRSYWLEKEK